MSVGGSSSIKILLKNVIAMAAQFANHQSGGAGLTFIGIYIFSVCLAINLFTVAILVLAPRGLTELVIGTSAGSFSARAIILSLVIAITVFGLKKSLLNGVNLKHVPTHKENIAVMLYVALSLITFIGAAGFSASFRS